jgi:hypothetical protein
MPGVRNTTKKSDKRFHTNMECVRLRFQVDEGAGRDHRENSESP